MQRLLLQFILFMTFFFGLQRLAHAVQWKQLNSSSHHKIAYDEQSIRQTPLGRMAITLRYTPRSTADRKSAAGKYKEKQYRSHLEYYEIDCNERAAFFGVVDIVGVTGARIKRLDGHSQSELILPGSLLDSTVDRICPIRDEENESENEEELLEEPQDSDSDLNATPDSGTAERIEALRTKAASQEATAETWKELGNIYFDNNLYGQAIDAYQRALDLHGDDVDILNDQGAMYRQTGDFEKALARFEKASAVAPDNLESLYNSGYVYAFDLNNISKALVLWRKYLKLDSKSETAQQVKSFLERYEQKPASK